MTRELELYSPAARNSIRSGAGSPPEEIKKVRMRTVTGQVFDEEVSKISVSGNVAKCVRIPPLAVKPMPQIIQGVHIGPFRHAVDGQSGVVQAGKCLLENGLRAPLHGLKNGLGHGLCGETDTVVASVQGRTETGVAGVEGGQSVKEKGDGQIRKIAAGEDRFGEPGGKGVAKGMGHAVAEVAVGLIMQGDVLKPASIKPGPEGIMVGRGRSVEPDRDFCGCVTGEDIAQKRCVEAECVRGAYSGGQAGFDLAEFGEAGEDDEGRGGVVHWILMGGEGLLSVSTGSQDCICGFYAADIGGVGAVEGVRDLEFFVLSICSCLE